MNSRRKCFIACAAALALASPLAATAQTDDSQEEIPLGPNELEEIIVTATRRDVSILDVPLSIEAFSQEMLDQKGIRNIEDLARYTPGMSLSQGFSNIKYISIRGLSSSVGATMTGIYIDDTPIHIRSLVLMTFFYPALYDLERVEVLRGPQGTLFGSSAMGGAVRFITAKPNLSEFEGNFRSELGFTEDGDPSYEAGVAIGGPIIQDTLGFRANINYRKDGGYIDRVPWLPERGTVEANSNSGDTLVANAALTWRPIENLTITPSYFHQEVNRDDVSTYWTFGNGSTRPQPPIYEAGEGLASTGSDETDLFQAKIQWDVGPVSLISNTAYVDRHIQSFDDSTAFILDLYSGILGTGALGDLFNGLILPLAGASGPLNFEMSLPGLPGSPDGRCGECTYIELDMIQEGWTQEFRVQSSDPDARFQYVVGGFYQTTDQSSHEFDVAPWAQDGGFLGTGSPIARAIFGTVLLPVGPTGLTADSYTEITDEQTAVFGQADFEVVDKLTLTAGLRYSILDFESQSIAVDVTTGEEFVLPRRTSREKPVTPKFGIQYDFSDNLMAYASAAEGFRSGGVNTASEGTPDEACQAGLALIGYTEIPATYESDSTWNYEIGAKGLVGGNLSFAADVFYTEWDDVQRTRQIPGCINIFTDNLGKARSQGVEARVTFVPAEGLTLDAGVAYVDATSQETLYVPGTENTIIRKGDRFATPWTVNLSADYSTPIRWNNASAYGTVQYTYRSDWDIKPGNVAANPILFHTDDQQQLNFRLGIRHRGYDVSAFINNITNSTDIIGRLHFQPSERIQVQTWRPRTYGVTVRYNF